MRTGRRLLTLIALGIAACTAAMPASAEASREVFPYCSYSLLDDGWVSTADDVRKMLREKRAEDVQPGFVEATDATVNQFRALFQALNRDDLTVARSAAKALGYNACLLRNLRRDGEVDRFLFLSKDQTQQIHLLWRLGKADPIIIQSPHNFKDQRDKEKATESFVRTRARLLIANSLHANDSKQRSPCSGNNAVSNGAHYHKGWFHAAHVASAELLPDHGVFQLHGMASRRGNGDVNYIDISPGFKKDQVKEHSLLRYFDNALVESFGGDYASKYIVSAASPSPWTRVKSGSHLPGTFNTQGRHLNGSPEPCRKKAQAVHYENSPQRFVHVELSSNPRQRHLDDLINALNIAAAEWRTNAAGGDAHSLEGAKLQVGTMRVSDKPAFFTDELDAYEQPVIIAGIPGMEGKHPVVVEAITGLTPALQLREWSYLDGWHRYESVPYLIAESGRFESDQLQLEAGHTKFDAGLGEMNVHFQATFEGKPVVLLTEKNNERGDVAALRITNLNSEGFTVKAFVSERAQAIGKKLGGIELGFLAVYERAEETVGSASVPLIGGSAVMLKTEVFQGNHTPQLMGVLVQEEQSSDGEAWHTNEEVGLVVIDELVFGHMQSLYGADPAALRRLVD
ncbi:hypothetical protein [Allohahella marinimesophila]|uniref:Uncharacterized protein n=1 Tax=Allohahella marinimesophila TaxID=1054972 RepID=A0ABP7PGM2_9GAMM